LYNGIKYGTATATRLRNGQPTKLIKILAYIRDNGPVTRYDITTKVLGKQGTRKDLRGYYSTNFIKYRNSNLIELDWDTMTYTLGESGRQALLNYPIAV
jgi:hypothetical protein